MKHFLRKSSLKAAEVRQLLLRHKKTRGPAPEQMDDPSLVSRVTAFNPFFYILSPELLFHSAFLPLSLSISFFWMWTIFKVDIEFVTILFLFYIWFFVHEACGLLVPWPGIKLAHPALEGEILTTGLQGHPSTSLFLSSFSFSPAFSSLGPPSSRLWSLSNPTVASAKGHSVIHFLTCQ